MWELFFRLAYHLLCAHFGHKPWHWFEASGPQGTKARQCCRCNMSQHLIYGVREEWQR